jgi:hypothetical protein
VYSRWKYTDVSEVLNAFIVALMMEAVHTSETLVYSETTRRYIPESSNLDGISSSNCITSFEFDIKVSMSVFPRHDM